MYLGAPFSAPINFIRLRVYDKTTNEVIGRTDRDYHAKLRRLPDAAERSVPVSLTHRAGGPLSVTQNPENGELVPVAQTYIVEAELLDPDPSVGPGALVAAKIHCRWRSCGWWVKRKISEALDIGLYQ